MGKLKNLFLLHGEEDFLAEEHLASIMRRLGSGVDVERIDGQSGSLDVVIPALSSLPLLGGNKLVIIKNFKGLAPSGRRKKEADEEECDGRKDIDALIRALSSGLSENVTVVFLVNGSVDKRKKLYKFIAETGNELEFKPFAQWEEEKLLAWIVARVRAGGKSIKSHAVRRLAEISGSNMRFLSLEIDKIVTYVGDRESVEEADVLAVASQGSISVFSLAEHMRARDVKGSLLCLSKLFRDKEDPIALLGFLAKQFRTFLQIRSMRDSGLSMEEIASALRANPYFLKKSAEGAQSFSAGELKRNLEILHKTDIELKSTSFSQQLTMELAVINMCA